jgi:hypothetical protein
MISGAPVERSGRDTVRPVAHVVDFDENPAALARWFAGRRVERPASVTAAIDLAARSQPDVVVLRVPLAEVARTDALRRLHAVAPASRVVLIPMRPADPGDTPSPSEGDLIGGGAGRGLAHRFLPGPEAVVRSCALRPRAESVRAARSIVRSVCTDADAGELCFAALLVGTELVTNAVLHARSALGLTVHAWPAGVRIEVRDRVSERPVLRPVDVSAAGGRGFVVMDALCSVWGIDPLARGKAIWAGLLSSPSLLSAP